MHSFQKNAKVRNILLGFISCNKFKKRTLRSLKECKRTLLAERKRTRCPTLTNSWQQYCGIRILSDPELFPGSEYKTKLLVLVWLNLLKNNLLVLKNNPDPGSKGICWNTIISLTQKHIRIQNINHDY